MRIEGYIDHPEIKITVMKMNNKYTVKFEKYGMEQNYKFNQSEYLSGVVDIRKIVNEVFVEEVDTIFLKMNKLKVNTLDSLIESGGDDFPNII